MPTSYYLNVATSKQKTGINGSFSAESCRELTFQPSLSFANGHLKNHIINSYEVHNMHECEWVCYQEHDCVSVNFKTKPNTDGKHRCELNNSTHAEHNEDLINAENYIYRGTEVRHSVYFSPVTQIQPYWHGISVFSICR